MVRLPLLLKLHGAQAGAMDSAGCVDDFFFYDGV